MASDLLTRGVGAEKQPGPAVQRQSSEEADEPVWDPRRRADEPDQQIACAGAQGRGLRVTETLHRHDSQDWGCDPGPPGPWIGLQAEDTGPSPALRVQCPALRQRRTSSWSCV